MVLLLVLVACNSKVSDTAGDSSSGGATGTAGSGGSGGTSGNTADSGDTGTPLEYAVYAHGDHELYRIDLQHKALLDVGPFNAPSVGGGEDVITDLAVEPDGTIYGVSNTELYTVDAADGHVTKVGSLSACGSNTVALTATVDGKLYAGDYKGAFCQIDTSKSTPTVRLVGTLGGNLALSGDLVAIGDGTMYGTAINTKESWTTDNNLLVQIDPTTGKVTSTIGTTGYGRMFGAAYALGKVFGFTHDGSGDVVTIDPKSGVGTLYGSFDDPSSGNPISFAGAAVNAKVPPTIGH